MSVLAISATLIVTMSILHWNYVENNKRKVSIEADGDSDDDDDDGDDAGQQEDDHPQPLGQAEARGVRPWEALRGGADGQVVIMHQCLLEKLTK